jgi:hypothetical protein
VDGDGNVESTDLVWDDEDKILFAYATGTFTCKNGGTGEADMLIATNGAGTPRKRPAGSGFWVVEIDKGECAAMPPVCLAAASMRRGMRPLAAW